MHDARDDPPFPLSAALAESPGPLAEAVARWRSESAAERDAASRAVRRILERELAPLLEAMRSDEPEVRRRAQAALESFLPERPPEPGPAQDPQVGQPFILFGQPPIQWQAQRLRFRLAFGGNDLDPEEDSRLERWGLVGEPVEDPAARTQLAEGSGFSVKRVDEGSDAARLGLMPGDILLTIDGNPVMRVPEVAKALARPEPDEITLLRRGKLVVRKK